MSLDSCIADIFEPGNFNTDSGAITTPHYSGFFLLEETTDHFELDAEDEVTAWFLSTGSDFVVNIAGTWSGTITADVGEEGPPGTITVVGSSGSITTNGVYQTTRGQAWMRYRMTGYVSGTALIYVPGADFAQHILVEEGGATVGKLKLE